mgnify:CR=1 FL=1
MSTSFDDVIFSDNFTISKTSQEVQLQIEAIKQEVLKGKERIEKTKEKFTYKDMARKYKTVGELGRGGMGIVYRVHDTELYRDLAMKVVIPKSGKDEAEKIKSVQGFLEEAQITAQLEHPNIVPVHDIGLHENGDFYFTMKKVDGENLRRILIGLLKEEPEYLRTYTLPALLGIFRKVCDAIAFAHSRGIVNRDIKPDNVMIGQYGEVLVMDWGLAKYIGDKGRGTIVPVHSDRIYSDFYKTPDSLIQGTPLYISPEQLEGNSSKIDQLSDIYLLGGTLYNILTLWPPHYGKDIEEVVENVLKGRIVNPQERNPSRQIPEELCRIAMKALALKRENRYRNVEELCLDLDLFLSGEIVSTPVKLKAGEFLMHSGETGNHGYLLLKGSVEVYQDIGGKKSLLATVGPGNFVGEMAIIASSKRSADAVVAEDSEALVIDNKQVKDILKRVPPWMEKLLEKLVERLLKANNNVHPLLIDNAEYHVLHQIAAIASLRAYRKKITRMEEMELSGKSMAKEVSTTLCIPLEKVEPILIRLTETTQICQKTGEDSFHFSNFNLFCHVLDFLREVFELDTDYHDLEVSLDEQTKIERCKIGGKLSQKAKELLLNLPGFARLMEA